MPTKTEKGVKRLSFEVNPNNKLLCPYFICVLSKRRVKSSQRLDIRISDRHFCYADVACKRLATLAEICDSYLCMADLGYEAKQYKDHMEWMYSSKPWWKGDDTEFEVVAFRKVVQLDMFG